MCAVLHAAPSSRSVLTVIVAAFVIDYHLLQLHNLVGLDDNTVVTLILNLGMSFM